MKQEEKIIVLDYGSQYNQLITRRIRELGVYSELHPNDLSAKELKDLKPTGIILSGGPNSVFENDAFSIDEEIFQLDIPVLGICYGMQLMAYKLGGRVEPAAQREYGKAKITLTGNQSATFHTLPEEQIVWMSHGDHVVEMPEGFQVDAKNPSCPIAAISNEEKKFYGVQFHPEVGHSVYGNDLLKNFVYEICGCSGEWTMKNFIETEIEKIRESVKDRKVICALSGGVDSSVVAVLLHQAIGDQLTCIFVDHGLLRKNEAEDVMKMFKEGFHMNVIQVDAKDRFLAKLEGVSDPEKNGK